MNISKDRILSFIINYIPGVIILIFSMVALYATVLLIHTREDLSDRYHTYVVDIIDFQKAFFNFELSHDAYLAAQDNEFPEGLKTKFHTMNERFIRLKSDFYNYSARDPLVNQKHEHFLFLLQQNIKDIIQIIMLKEENASGGDGVDYKHELHESVERMFESVMGLQVSVFKNFEDTVFSQSLENREIWLYWSVIAMGLSGFILVVLNIDKIRSMQSLHQDKFNTLKILENRMAALDLSQDGICILDADGRVSYLNASMCNIVGIDVVKRDNYIGRGWIHVFSEYDFHRIRDDISPIFQDGESHWIGDFIIHRLDGTDLETELSITQFPDGGFIGTFQDISEKRKSEKEKRDLEDQFYQAQKMEAVGRLAGGIAHDFNNILAAMNGYAEFLLDDLDENTEQHGFARNILLAGMQARDLVDQMLVFSRRGDNTRSILDVVSSTREVLSMIRATITKTVDLETHIDVETALIEGNVTHISQMMMNLCVNALDAMEDNHGLLKVSIDQADMTLFDEIKGVIRDQLPEPSETPYQRIDDIDAFTTRLISGHFARDTPYIRLGVQDTGCGMSRIIMEQIFEPFFTTKSVDKGTGLGLATVHGLVISHLGVLVIESTLGQGTFFDIYIPLAQPSEDNILVESAGAKKDRTAHDERHILLVEDQESVRRMTRRMLQRLGYMVSTARSGLEGLDMVRENPTAYDLVITDYNMPKMSGFEMIQQIHIDMPDVPFIMLSGYSQERMSSLINMHPAVKCILRKPASSDDLSKEIEAVFYTSLDETVPFTS